MNMTTLLRGASVLAVAVWAAAPPPWLAAQERPSADQLLKDADRARGGLATGITWTASVETTDEESASSRTFLVKARGDDALVEALAPARYKGEIMLFNDRTIWFVKPGLRRPVSISARQRLHGDASNGDIASTNYARDYEGTVVGETTVDGKPVWTLELKARARNVTYDRIRYWVSKKGHLGMKAEFLTVGGDLFKSATFEYGNRARTPAGEFDFVSRMTIADATGAGTVTTIVFGPPRVETHPSSMFNINNVMR
ncbi:MAG: outer membrane lipoprotein-sorting protein [Acidobacteria bacterium]|nr:outer membrane lipoprotein-sorting protein [Acidobacteriota bacterium]